MTNQPTPYVRPFTDFLRQGSLMFTDHDGNLIGNDPHQLTALNVDPATGEVSTP
jgi:hypothetical protein